MGFLYAYYIISYFGCVLDAVLTGLTYTLAGDEVVTSLRLAFVAVYMAIMVFVDRRYSAQNGRASVLTLVAQTLACQLMLGNVVAALFYRGYPAARISCAVVDALLAGGVFMHENWRDGRQSLLRDPSAAA